jgi:hypothetical protein
MPGQLDLETTTVSTLLNGTCLDVLKSSTIDFLYRNFVRRFTRLKSRLKGWRKFYWRKRQTLKYVEKN